MKTKLEVINLKNARDAQKSKMKRARTKIDRPTNLTRLMAYDPSKVSYT